MNVIPLFVSYAETPPQEEPFKAGFDDVAQHAQTATVFVIAVPDIWNDATAAQWLADLVFRVISAISKNVPRATLTASVGLLDRRNGVDEGDRALRVVDVGSRVFDRQRHAVDVSDQMALGAVFSAIRGIWPGFLPPKMARTEQLSRTPFDQSIAPVSPSSSRKRRQKIVEGAT